MYLRTHLLASAIAVISFYPSIQPVKAEQPVATVVEIRFEGHRFRPDRVEVPAATPIAIRLINASKERIEFESFKLRFERVVEPGAMITVELPALGRGKYDFFDDFHDDVPDGVIVAK